MEFDGFPRILLVNGEPINLTTGTGITLANLFSGWPREALTQVVSAPFAPPPGIAHPTYKLDVARRTVTTRPQFNVTGGSSVTAGGSSLRRVARDVLDLVPYSLPAWFDRELTAFAPELVYTCSSNIQITRLATSLARRFSVPLVPHFMDDWLATRYSGVLFALQRVYLLRATAAMMRAAQRGIAISAEMAKEYEARFQVPFSVFMNCVNVPRTPAPPPSGRGQVRMLYVGGLHLNRWRSLRTLADNIAALGLPSQLVVHAPAAHIRQFGEAMAGPALELGGPLSQAQVADALASADVLVHVESFAPADRKYTRLSMSTKIPQYLAAARPVLAFGPLEAASVRFIRDHGCGWIAASDQEIGPALRSLVDDAAARERCARAAHETALEQFDAAAVRSRFQRCMRGLAVPPMTRGAVNA